MAAGCGRPVNNFLTQDADKLEASYRAWQTRRPQLFQQRAASIQMASNTKVCICIVADGQERPVKLSNAIHASTASKSLISTGKATASRGAIRTIEGLRVVDHLGTPFTSTATITLRWYYDDGAQTFNETFYIIDPTSGDLPWDAVLRAAAEAPSVALTPQVNVLCSAPTGSTSQRDAEKERRKADNEKYQREKKDHVRKLKEAYESKHPKPKAG